MIAGDPIYDQLGAALREATGRDPASIDYRGTPDGSVWSLIGRSYRDRDEHAWATVRPLAIMLLNRRRELDAKLRTLAHRRGQ